MDGLRGFLISIANLILFVLLFLIPLGVFWAAGDYGQVWNRGFNWNWGLIAGLMAFGCALPACAFLAVFLDIREQLVRMNARDLGSQGFRDHPTPTRMAPSADTSTSSVGRSKFEGVAESYRVRSR